MLNKIIMKNLKTITAFLLLTAFIFLLMIPFTGCSSIKKHKEKESVEVEMKKELDSSATTKTKTEQVKKVQVKETEEATEEATEIQVKDGESLEITNYDYLGRKTGYKTYKGSGSIKNTSGKKKTEKFLDNETKTKIDSESKIETSKRTDAKAKASKASAKKEKKGFSFWSYLWLFIIIVILTALYYLNKRFNFLGIIKSVS